MSQMLQLITPPAAEPVSLGEFKELLRIPLTDTSRDGTLTRFLLAARHNCEHYCRIKLITQTWLAKLDSFPGSSIVYERNGYPEFRLPYPPFQSIQFFKYVDTAGAVQTMTRDTSYGNNVTGPIYSYQLEQGTSRIPAKVVPAFATPWAPQRMVPANTLLQFRCGFGGPVTVSVAQGSPILSSPGFTFNADDAPALTGDTGTKISIPGAGAAGKALVTHIASVDGSGVATLADVPATAAANAVAWLGAQVPDDLKLSILFEAQFYHEQGAVVDMDPPGIVETLRTYHRNDIS